MKLAGKVALVTGGATGIGAAIVSRFGQEGAKVTVADINEVAGKVAAQVSNGIFVHCDTSSPEDAANAVAKTVTEFGGLDILINCAAHLGGYYDVAGMSPEVWREVMAVSLDGVFYCAKYAAQEMLRRGGGAIVNVASVEGMMGAAGHAAYVTAKSALFGLTRSMAIDFGTRGIRVNAISPGIIDSGRPDLVALKQDPVLMRFWRDMTVLDRMGQPKEIASAVLFLASDEASYVTGQNLAVDGGWTIGHPPVNWPKTTDLP